MQDFLNEHLGSHRLGLSKTRNVLQTLVLSNDQPDLYVFAKDFREAEEKRQVNIRIRGFICHESQDENE